jgi:hypothetical protein
LRIHQDENTKKKTISHILQNLAGTQHTQCLVSVVSEHAHQQQNFLLLLAVLIVCHQVQDLQLLGNQGEI